MQFNVALLVSALLVTASPALSVVVAFFDGSDCTGQVIGQSDDLPANHCLSAGSGSARSISYSDVPNKILFFASGGAHDTCTNGAQLTLYDGSGCSTAPDGFNWESTFYN